MIAYWVLGVAILVGLLLAGNWFTAAKPHQILTVLKWVVFAVLILVIGFLAVTGRLSWALMSLPILLPWFLRARAFGRMAKNFSRMARGQAGVGSGQTSGVQTRFLRMSLDHDSGEMTGEVIEGPYAGRRLDDLALNDLLVLLGQWLRQDEESAQVLSAYLDRREPDWRDKTREWEQGQSGASGGGSGHASGGFADSGAMTRDEAYEVLGLEPGASEAAIREAYKRLIANLHPDKGGSSYLAAQINRAKDVLLGRP
ncbi:MAG: DnaJ domain-containing protein [Rhodospirillales bacterium]